MLPFVAAGLGCPVHLIPKASPVLWTEDRCVNMERLVWFYSFFVPVSNMHKKQMVVKMTRFGFFCGEE